MSTTTSLAASGLAAPLAALSGETVDAGAATVVDAIARHARERSDHPAILSGEQPPLSYAELWDHASRLADALAGAGVRAGDQVAIWATRSAPVVAASVAAMALGASYLPIDPTYPAARVRRILEVGDPRVMVCADAASLAGSLPQGLATVDIHAGPHSAPDLEPVAGPEAIAYTVFTTGSTGLPKGVLVGHRALTNYLGWSRELTGFGPDDATPCFASLGFDHAVTCLWLPLFVGGAVQLVPDSWDPRPWLAPRERPFAFVKITPSHVRLFERIARPDYRQVTRTVMFGGERLDAALVTGLAERLDGVALLNHYGPTEATVGCTAYRFDSAAVAGDGALPIGTPVWNSRAYVLDEELRPVPPGDEGELVLAGACVADGYLGGGESDRDRFLDEAIIAGPAATAARSSRAYRTGDRVVVRDGVLHYLGRLDEQVKVRGYRIEITEVHDLALAVPGVDQVAVSVSQSGLGGLELFVVPEDARTPTVAAVLEHLRANLPAAAVPAKVWIVPELVANAHGKWDPDATRALAAVPEEPS
ncbi:MAG: amino acid adenylation domain-containing protein [Actinomycetota bacterium]|jgi:amino acid adenylation domain-containing protein|nr:amino acid adenylation domain-containing protein [Actinomycetota bacterium]